MTLDTQISSLSASSLPLTAIGDEMYLRGDQFATASDSFRRFGGKRKALTL